MRGDACDAVLHGGVSTATERSANGILGGADEFSGNAGAGEDDAWCGNGGATGFRAIRKFGGGGKSERQRSGAPGGNGDGDGDEEFLGIAERAGTGEYGRCGEQVVRG